MYAKMRDGKEVKPYTGDGSVEFDLPLDFLALIKIFIRMYGNLIATFASGTPVARQGSVMNSVLSSIRLSIGGDVIKSASPEMFRIQNLLVNKFAPMLRATAGASATNNAATDIAGGASVSYGTTGQYQNFEEHLTLFCMIPWVEKLSEQYSTAVRTKGLTECKLELVQQAALTIRDGANTAPVVYSGLSALKFVVDYEELKEDAKGELDNESFYKSLETYRQIQQSHTFSGENDTNTVDLNGRTGRIMCQIFKLRDGAAGSATTATSKLANDAIITKMDVWGDDSERYADSSWRGFKGVMKQLKGYSAPLTNGVGEDTGVSGIFWVNKNKGEAIDVRKHKTLQLVFKSEAQATATDYGTEGAVLKILTDYITTR